MADTTTSDEKVNCESSPKAPQRKKKLSDALIQSTDCEQSSTEKTDVISGNSVQTVVSQKTIDNNSVNSQRIVLNGNSQQVLTTSNNQILNASSESSQKIISAINGNVQVANTTEESTKQMLVATSTNSHQTTNQISTDPINKNSQQISIIVTRIIGNTQESPNKINEITSNSIDSTKDIIQKESSIKVAANSQKEVDEGVERLTAQIEKTTMENTTQTKESEKKTAKTKADVMKAKPESPRTRLKLCERDQKHKNIEQLQQENAALKKALESERSALREQKAQYEAEMRKDKAEARRREASLEGQLRSALKGTAVTVVPNGSVQDNALVAALEATKAANKCLQQKLQVLTEADKRKASELRAQHDAHVLQLQQLERQARAQTAQLLEELKAKERQLNQGIGKTPVRPSRSIQNLNRGPVKMGVAEQLHLMEGQISRLESELQRRDDIIQSLRNSKSKKEKQLISRHHSKDCILKDTISDVDSAVSSGPNSLSPQPSPDLWFQSQDNSLSNVEENMLEIAKRQIQELELALSISKASHQNAQLRATQLEEQLQDLREHADLLEFRCLELEDTSEKRNSLGEMTDCDSGCTSPEVCLKNPVSPPHLRRSDSGYKSPTNHHRTPSSPKLKNHRVLRTPTESFSSQIDDVPNEHDIAGYGLHCNISGKHQGNDIKDRLERIILNTHSDDDRNCLEQVLHLLWNLQSLSSSFAEEDFSTMKNRKSYEIDYTKGDYEQNKVSKIIATISPYSHQKGMQPDALLSKSDNQFEVKAESKKLLLGLQESGIFEDTEVENKETQTECCDFVDGELATEVQRLNQIREELEKSAATRSKMFGASRSDEDLYELDMLPERINKKHLEYYENRIATLENKIDIYESTSEVRDKKLAQRLQREINLQTRINILEDDLNCLRDKYAILEEERCEFEEAENDTRLHCQVLQTEFDIQTAKLRDIDEERSCARNEADCYRALVEEYENKSTYLQEQEKELKEKIKIMESAVPALVFWNIWKIVDKYPDFDFKAACKAKFETLTAGGDCNEALQPEILAMIDYLSLQTDDTNSLFQIDDQLHSTTTEDKEDVREKCKLQEDILRSKMVAMEKIVLENSVLCKKQEEAAAMKIKALEEELQSIRDNQSLSLDTCNRTNNLNCDEKCKSKIQTFIDKENEYRERIKALENREVMLLMTLTQADEMWAGVENKYKLQIKQLEDNEVLLKEHTSEAESDKNKWKGKCEPLTQKVNELEDAEAKLEADVKRLVAENRELLAKCESLEDQLSSLKIELQHSKEQAKNLENKYKNELVAQKKKVGFVQEELQMQKKQQIDGDEAHNSKISLIKKQLSKTTKDLQELEVTNGELKEEVETLEKEVQKISNELTKCHNENEEKIKQLLQELSMKSKEVESLQKELIDYQKLPSAHEELEQLYKNTPKSPSGDSSPVPLSPSENKSNNTVSQVISQIQCGLRNENTTKSSTVEKPALPKRKPKLNLDITKIGSKKSADGEKQRSIGNKQEDLMHEALQEKSSTQLTALDCKSECFKNNENDPCDVNNVVVSTPSDTTSVNNECAIKQCREGCGKCGKTTVNLLQDSLNKFQKAFPITKDLKNDDTKNGQHLNNNTKNNNCIYDKVESECTYGIRTHQDKNEDVAVNKTTTFNNKITNETVTNHVSVKRNLSLNHGSYKQTTNTKTMGNFVLDRVSKLMSGMTDSHMSLPMIADDNKLIGKNVYIYNL